MKLTGHQRAESLIALEMRGWIAHLACLGVFFVAPTRTILAVAVVGYFIRVFSWEVGAHRYFSHRSFKTSRAFQCLLGGLSAASGQRGPIWWAIKHRNHHRHSDTALDLHSPVVYSFWKAHYGWFVDQDVMDTDLDAAKDLSRYPELVWINKHHYLLPLATLIVTFLVGQYTALFGRTGLGISAAVWAFFLPTVLSQHAAFSVNTLTHGFRPGLFHSRRFATADTTTNVWPLAVATMGAAWHNNHHRYMNSARAGFCWWELDLGHLTLRVLSALHIVWDLHPVPDAVLAEGKARRNPAPERS
jgi:stearoyl-CoA desaturase (delta-9 desaturase)